MGEGETGVSKPKYRRTERETVILYNEAEETATVCTFNRKLKKKLAKLAARFPDLVRLKEVSAECCLPYLFSEA